MSRRESLDTRDRRWWCCNNVAAPAYLTLYLKANCNRISCPLNSGGSGGNGTEALIPATAARSNASLPEGVSITSFGTWPVRSTMNWTVTIPRFPKRALDGITVSQFLRTKAKMRARYGRKSTFMGSLSKFTAGGSSCILPRLGGCSVLLPRTTPRIASSTVVLGGGSFARLGLVTGACCPGSSKANLGFSSGWICGGGGAGVGTGGAVNGGAFAAVVAVSTLGGSVKRGLEGSAGTGRPNSGGLNDRNAGRAGEDFCECESKLSTLTSLLTLPWFGSLWVRRVGGAISGVTR